MIRDLTYGELFAGYDGLGMGVRSVLGGSLTWYADVCRFNKDGTAGHFTPHRAPCSIMAHHHPDAPNLGDVTTARWSPTCPTCAVFTYLARDADGEPLAYLCRECGDVWPLDLRLEQMAELGVYIAEPVDVLGGGSPCQDLSHAGRRKGMRAGTRSGLWASMVDAIDIIRPRLVVWENVRGALSAEADSDLEPCPGCLGDPDDGAVLRALGRVLGDLADIGYDANWYGLPAAAVGAAHGRFRIFVFAFPADPDGTRSEGLVDCALEVAARLHGQPVEGVGAAAELEDPPYLLPTPNDFHMGNSETPEEWRARRLDVFQRTGTRHGPALPVVALSIVEGDALIPETYMPDEDDDVAMLPTPDTRNRTSAASKAKHPGGGGGWGLSDILLPTPEAKLGSAGPDYARAGREGSGGDDLTTTMAKLMPTPRATDGTKGGPNQRGSSGDQMLPSMVQDLLPTPSAADGNGGSRYSSEGHQRTLPGEARLLPTPTRGDGSGGGVRHKGGNPTLRGAVEEGLPLDFGEPVIEEPMRYLPTPVVTDAASSARHTTTTGVAHPGTSLTDATRLFPTPEAGLGSHNRDNGVDPAVRREQGRQVSLADVTRHETGPMLPTPRVASERTSRGALTREGHWSAPGLAQAVEFAEGILPREYQSWDEVQGNQVQDWREYGPAVRRQEIAFGRSAPAPTEPGTKGQPRLSPRFVEWLMGLPDGHVTSVPGVSRNDQLKALGNGVVPPQVAAATRAFIFDLWTEHH